MEQKQPQEKYQIARRKEELKNMYDELRTFINSKYTFIYFSAEIKVSAHLLFKFQI